MPRIRISDKDLDRGKRFCILTKNLFPGFSREKIGVELGGFGGSTIRDWEAGASVANISIRHLINLGVNIGWLLTGEGSMLRTESPQPISPPQSTPAELRAMGQRLIALADQLEDTEGSETH